MTLYSNNIIAYFAENGVPKTGLSATIDIYRVSDNVQVISSAALIEIGGGGYKYVFTGCDTNEEYFFVIDGSSVLLNGQRYATGSIEHQEIRELILESLDKIVSSPTKGSLLYYTQSLQRALINKWNVDVNTGDIELFDDNEVSLGTISEAIGSDGITTIRKTLTL
jgi:hypothetical protein